MNNGSSNDSSIRRVQWLTLGMVAAVAVFPLQSVVQANNASEELVATARDLQTETSTIRFVEEGTTEPGPFAGMHFLALGRARPCCIHPSDARERCCSRSRPWSRS
jgi:hypothetical protein